MNSDPDPTQSLVLDRIPLPLRSPSDVSSPNSVEVVLSTAPPALNREPPAVGSLNTTYSEPVPDV